MVDKHHQQGEGLLVANLISMEDGAKIAESQQQQTVSPVTACTAQAEHNTGEIGNSVGSPVLVAENPPIPPRRPTQPTTPNHSQSAITTSRGVVLNHYLTPHRPTGITHCLTPPSRETAAWIGEFAKHYATEKGQSSSVSIFALPALVNKMLVDGTCKKVYANQNQAVMTSIRFDNRLGVSYSCKPKQKGISKMCKRDFDGLYNGIVRTLNYWSSVAKIVRENEHSLVYMENGNIGTTKSDGSSYVTLMSVCSSGPIQEGGDIPAEWHVKYSANVVHGVDVPLYLAPVTEVATTAAEGSVTL